MAKAIQTSLLEEQKHSERINSRIFFLALGMFALGTDAFVIAGVLPVVAKETDVTIGLAGQLITVFSLTYGLGAPLLAALTGRWSRNRVLIGALGLVCLSNLGSALAPSFPLLMLSRILTGCFAATYAPLAYATGISLAPPARRGQALALVVIGLTVATVLGAPAGTWIGEHFGWRFSFGLVSLIAGVAFLMLLLCGLPKAEKSTMISLKERLAPIGRPRVVLALLPALLWNMGTYVAYAYVATLLQHNMHISDISGLLIVYGLGNMIGNWSGGWLVDRFNPNRLIVIFLILLTITQTFLALATTTVIGGIFILFIWGVTSSTTFIPQQRHLLSMAPKDENVILALNNSTLYLGIAFGAALGGLALHMVAVTQLCWLGAIGVLLALLLFLLSWRLHGNAPDEEHRTEARQTTIALE